MIDRESPRCRPTGRPAGYQNWRQLLFVHWRVRPSAIASLLPDGLTVDTFDGAAWVGLIPFTMTNVRPRWFPAVPGCSSFHETNVRTYVHFEGRAPGVWFFSLDAASSLAVRIARWRWHLPYFRAEMALTQQDRRIKYRSRRLWPGSRRPSLEIDAEFGDWIPSLDPRVQPGESVVSSLEYFLAERYYLYAADAQGTLYRGQVHHRPYRLRNARLWSLEENLLAAAGITVTNEPDHCVYCDGVETSVFPIRAVGLQAAQPSSTSGASAD